MSKTTRKYFIIGLIIFAAFLIFTALVAEVDVREIGPAKSSVGLAGINEAVFDFFGGENIVFYNITDWLGIVAILTALGFACLGLFQLIKRKKIKLVDKDLYVLAALYIAVAFEYFIFEHFVINCRPIIIDGYLEASYPSSHTMIVVSIMVTAFMQFRARLKNRVLKLTAEVASLCIAAVTVIGRLISGAHWITDIIGGLLLSAALIVFYLAGVSAVGAMPDDDGKTEKE